MSDRTDEKETKNDFNTVTPSTLLNPDENERKNNINTLYHLDTPSTLLKPDEKETKNNFNTLYHLDPPSTLLKPEEKEKKNNFYHLDTPSTLLKQDEKETKNNFNTLSHLEPDEKETKNNFNTVSHLETLCTVLVSNPAGSFTPINKMTIHEGHLWVYFTPRWSGEYTVKIFERVPGDRFSEQPHLLQEVPVVIQENVQNECYATVPILVCQSNVSFPGRTVVESYENVLVRIITPKGKIVPGWLTMLEGDDIKIDFEPECAGEYLAEMMDQDGNIIGTVPVVIGEEYIHDEEIKLGGVGEEDNKDS